MGNWWEWLGRCPVCGSSGKDASSGSSDEGYSVSCSKCGHLFLED